MVVRRWQSASVVVGLVTIAGAIIWILLPASSTPSLSGYAGLVRTALIACRNAKGGNPVTLLEVEPFLEMITKTDCRFIQVDHDKYHIEMPIDERRTYYFDVTYMVDEAGLMEEYDVRATRSKRSRR